jgi:hypothetical protein
MTLLPCVEADFKARNFVAGASTRRALSWRSPATSISCQITAAHILRDEARRCARAVVQSRIIMKRAAAELE